ncbi:MAG: cache domain-containing protein [Ideonella sp.]|nr:cache domain-containing protein [Ideonella sp.]
MVYGLDGVVRAHGANEKMVGKNLMELKDVDGKAFVKDARRIGQRQGHVLAGLQVHQPGDQEDRAQERLLRKARRHRGLRRRLQVRCAPTDATPRHPSGSSDRPAAAVAGVQSFQGRSTQAAATPS